MGMTEEELKAIETHLAVGGRYDVQQVETKFLKTLVDEVRRLRAALLKVEEIACRSVSAAGYGDEPPEPANRDGEELAEVARAALNGGTP